MPDRRGNARPGNSYKDPAYDKIEAGLETKYGLPDGLLSRIRTRGERSNADQVSPVGAKSSYQIMPDTRNRFLKAYGVDAYSSPEAAAEVAALHLRDDYRRTKSWDSAVTRYIGGPDPRKWGRETAAYTQRVTGKGIDGAPATGNSGSEPAGPPLPEIDKLDLMTTRADQFDYARRPLAPVSADPDAGKEAKRLEKLAMLLPNGMAKPQAISNTPDLAPELGEQKAGMTAETKRVALANPAAKPIDPVSSLFGAVNPLVAGSTAIGQLFPGFSSRLTSAVEEEWLLPQLARTIDRTLSSGKEDPGYLKWYNDNRGDIEDYALSAAEVDRLRDTNSQADLAWTKKDIERSRANQESISSTDHATTFSLIAGLSDPVGWAAGAGVGKGFEVAGIGSRILLANGNKVAAVGSLALEGATGNVAFTGMLDAAGRTTTSEDYAMSAAFGLGIGVLSAPLVLRGKVDPSIANYAETATRDAQEAAGAKYAKAVENLGPEATPEAIKSEVERLDAVETRKIITTSLAPVPDVDRLLLSDPEKMLTVGEDTPTATAEPAKAAKAEVVRDKAAGSYPFETGKPVTVEAHHGTAAEFDEFNADALGSLTNAPSAKGGFFFTSRKKTADYYSKMAAREKNVGKRDKVDGTIMTREVTLENPLVVDMKGRVFRDESYDDIIKRAKEAGNDGVIFRRTYDAGEYGRFDATMRGRFRSETVYTAFDPKQIRVPGTAPVPAPAAELTGKALGREIRDRYGFDNSISDPTELKLVTELTAKAEQVVAANPINEKALNTILTKAGMESTGLRLLKSESPVAKAVGISLLESTTGAAGRRRTAAMSLKVRERLYNRDFSGFDRAYHNFRKEEGAGLVSEFVDGRVRKRFNERVYDEVEARFEQPDGTRIDPSIHVNEAADMWERGMTTMRKEMQHVGTVGSARLGTTSVGYMRHMLDARKVLKITKDQRAKIVNVLAGQFVDPINGFDAKFSKKLAVKYLQRAEEAAKGGFEVPMNLRDPEAADMVYDALKALEIPDMDIEKLMGKFSRGGADFTKQRLKLDLQADIGDGMILRDLFSSDLSSMYRGYARRTAGEVALAQYGIMGKKGLAELRKAADSTGASIPDLKAFDQVAAEFLNMPFGDANHHYMDNIRVATSVARLGGMGFTQFAEYGNTLAALGVTRTFGAIAALPRMAKEVGQIAKGGEAANPILASLDTLGGHIGLDEYTLTRMFDMKDNDVQVYSTENIGIGTRGLRGLAHVQAGLTGQRMITAVQTRALAEQIVRKAIGHIKKGEESIALADMGVSPDLAAEFKADLPNIATFDSAGSLLELDLMKSKLDGSKVMEFRDAIERGSSQIIQRTYIGETGKWAHNGFLKMLLQFRTFGVTSVEKQWGRGVRNYGAIKSSMYLLGAMSFAVPIHMARVQLKMTGMTRKERDKFAADNLTVSAMARATINYASASGLLGDVLDIGGGFASGLGGADGKAVSESVGVRGTKGQSKLLGGVVAPGVGLVEDAWAGIHGNGKKLVGILPGANLPYVQPIIDGITPEKKTSSSGPPAN